MSARELVSLVVALRLEELRNPGSNEKGEPYAPLDFPRAHARVMAWLDGVDPDRHQAAEKLDTKRWLAKRAGMFRAMKGEVIRAGRD